MSKVIDITERLNKPVLIKRKKPEPIYISYEDLENPGFSKREFELMMEWDEIIAKELGIES